MSLFYNVENGEEMNPLEIIGKKCFIRPLLKLSLFSSEVEQVEIKYFTSKTL